MADLSTVAGAEEWVASWRDHWAAQVVATRGADAEAYREVFLRRVQRVAAEQRANLRMARAVFVPARLAEYERAVVILERMASL